MRIRLESVPVTDQDHALAFYTEKLGFVKKRDVPMGPGARLLTFVSPEEPEGTELMLEPSGEHPATKTFKAALFEEGLPWTAFLVDDCRAEVERLKALGVTFRGEPVDSGDAVMATLDDTCGNWIMIYDEKQAG
ncbi:MAG: VOC family protein [Planctomycetota bacterium]|jgi:catechol 2,3-dioxygenase-like lactoylglutathione lyase family enzyme